MKDLKDLLDALPCPSFIINWDRKVIFWNKECEKLTGIKKGDVVGTSNYWRLYYKSKKDTAADYLLKLSKIKFHNTYETFIESGNKFYKCFAFALPSCIVEIAQDVTKFKKFEYKSHFFGKIVKYILRFSGCNTLESVGDVFIDMIKNLLNISACEIYEYDEGKFKLIARYPESVKGDEVINSSCLIFPLIKDVSSSKVNFLRNLYTGVFGEYCKENNLECIIAPLTSAGSLVGFVRIAFNPENIQVPVIEEFISLIVELLCAVLRRVKAEEMLLESEKKYRELFENLSEGIILSDKNCKIIKVNKAVEELLGYSREELLGKSIYDLHKDTSEKDELVTNVLKTGFVKGFRINYMKKDGTIIECLESIKTVEKNGKFAGFYEVIRDISQLKSVEEKLKRANYLLKLSRKVSRYIAREKTKGSVLTKICKILYEYGDEYFSSVWGIVKDERYRKYRVISHSKRIERIVYRNLNDMKCISFVKNGNVFISNIHVDICRKCKLKSEYKLKIIFPIKYEGEFFGVLCFNLKKNIDDESIGVLEEIVEDIGFSFRNIDVHRKLDTAIKQLKRNILSIETLADKMKNPLGVIYPLAEYISTEYNNMSDEEIKFYLNVMKKQTEKLKENFKLIEKVEKETLKFLNAAESVKDFE